MLRLNWTEEHGRRSYCMRSESYGFLRTMQELVGGEIQDQAETSEDVKVPESACEARPDEARNPRPRGTRQ